MMMASSTWWQRLVAASSCWTRSSALYSSVRGTSELNQAQSTIGHVHHGFDWGRRRALALSSSLIPKNLFFCCSCCCATTRRKGPDFKARR